MQAKFFKLFTTFFLLSTLFITGCVAPLIIGGVIVTGYAAAKDTVSGNLETTGDKLWNIALQVMSEKADIIEQDRQTGVIKAVQGNNKISLKMHELTEHSYNLRVSARRAVAFANLSLAQEVFTKIVRNMELD